MSFSLRHPNDFENNFDAFACATNTLHRNRCLARQKYRELPGNAVGVYTKILPAPLLSIVAVSARYARVDIEIR